MKRLLPLLVLLSACSAAPPPAPRPSQSKPISSNAPLAPTPARDPLSVPPASGITPSAPFPAIARRTLANGLEVAVITRKTLPIVELRLLFRSGTASDGPKPGVAAVAGELTKAGGAGPWNAEQLLERAESLGADLNVLTDRDSTRVSLGVTTPDLIAALEVLSAVATKPRFDAQEFGKLRTREVERAKSSAKSSAGYAASMILYRELFDVPTAIHPYARFDALPAELEKLSLADCKAWHKQHFTPRNAVLIAAGDIDIDSFAQAAEQAFKAWQGEKPEAPRFSDPQPETERYLYLVDRPGSGQSQVMVGRLGPTRQTKDWPALAVMNQVLGGGVAGRLFLDVREKRSLAYSTGSSVEEPAHSPVPIVLSAGTQTDKAPHAVQALLDNLQRLSSSPPSDAEVEIASRYLSDSFLFRTETVGALADMTAKLSVLGLPDDYYDQYRKAVRDIDASEATAKAGPFFKGDRVVIVVAGDAAKLSQRLTRFAKVIVIDPQQGFAPGKMLPMNASQPLD
ncbi:MAG TPA: pitrilysin family protein [Polyangiaceae bacterium]|nr:pitrilysin family protein [Polyangiaceae bacterium]